MKKLHFRNVDIIMSPNLTSSKVFVVKPLMSYKYAKKMLSLIKESGFKVEMKKSKLSWIYLIDALDEVNVDPFTPDDLHSVVHDMNNKYAIIEKLTKDHIDVSMYDTQHIYLNSSFKYTLFLDKEYKAMEKAAKEMNFTIDNSTGYIILGRPYKIVQVKSLGSRENIGTSVWDLDTFIVKTNKHLRRYIKKDNPFRKKDFSERLAYVMAL